ncbi:MAG: hypothetical protein EBT92_02235 [Planctomycetes bacterium]|nr:hypothetical protein [Planctomycetota bacterium]
MGNRKALVRIIKGKRMASFAMHIVNNRLVHSTFGSFCVHRFWHVGKRIRRRLGICRFKVMARLAIKGYSSL